MVNIIPMKNIKIKVNYLTLYFILIACLCGFIKDALYSLIIVIIHELGHVFITLLLGYQVSSVEIFPFGGITRINKYLNTPIIHDLLIAIFGIIFQLILCIFIHDTYFIKLNIKIMLFNLLPIIPLDGSKIILELYCLFLSFKNSLRLYYLTSFVFIIIYLILNYHYLLNNYLLCFLFIHKTIEVIKNRKLIYHKFIMERCLYNNLLFPKVKNKNEIINNYHKDIKYYYYLDSKIISDKEYLLNYYFNDDI